VIRATSRAVSGSRGAAALLAGGGGRGEQLGGAGGIVAEQCDTGESFESSGDDPGLGDGAGDREHLAVGAFGSVGVRRQLGGVPQTGPGRGQQRQVADLAQDPDRSGDVLMGARDVPRAAQWCERVREFSVRHELTSLLGVCRNHYAMVLAVAGAWADAEAELHGAAEQLALRPAQAAEGVARLGELRRRQGRHDEAERLLEDVAFLPEAQIWRGLLALDRGDPGDAVNIARRLLRQLPISDRLQRAHAHEIIAREQAELGDLAAAREALVEVEAAADEVSTAPMRAAAALAGGAVALASREPNHARALLEDAADSYARSNMPYEAAEARLLLAAALRELDLPDQAAAQVVRAADAYERLGADHAERVARALSADIRGSKNRSVLTRREIEVLSLVGEGMSDKAIAEQLTISEHTVHRHVSNILTKLTVTTRAAAAAQAAKLGLL